ncbi:2Fe-2S iron-sulfur cluster binding domain-containing protein [Corallococcus sp. ZKHCc1 1396]|uniref:2Fe-2S iron-sulfur cluster binding domain-containing protein n=1 Tax=Corallococcus soli TaxID=2710757 RepID=A0ABR9PQU7_9BACT|nr:2Fe-2S iron-sulfur cluster-binding protein [Corallococcus soli]MBE4750302.1 2Fe-2S iron-sulfur cluster binding domain-containing protein [Corallococcus soli]
MTGNPKGTEREYTLHVNGTPRTVVASGQDLLVDVLHEQLDLTGTKLSCGIGSCGACKVVAQKTPGSPKMAMLACYARMDSIEGLHFTTVEGLSGPGEALHPLQREFLECYSFQCGFSTPGFLMAADVLMDQLARRPIPAAQLDQRIRQAISGNVCRCTGYVKYAEAIKKAILADPRLTCETPGPAEPQRSVVTFRVRKQSSNDLEEKALVGFLDEVEALIRFEEWLRLDTCTARVSAKTRSVRTGEPVRDFNLGKFFFKSIESVDFTLDSVDTLDGRYQLDAVPFGTAIPVNIQGHVSALGIRLPVTADAVVMVLEGTRLRITSRAPVTLDMRDLGFSVDAFASEFFLRLTRTVEITFDLVLEKDEPRGPEVWATVPRSR